MRCPTWRHQSNFQSMHYFEHSYLTNRAEAAFVKLLCVSVVVVVFAAKIAIGLEPSFTPFPIPLCLVPLISTIDAEKCI